MLSFALFKLQLHCQFSLCFRLALQVQTGLSM
jgi:hypothetical protein